MSRLQIALTFLVVLLLVVLFWFLIWTPMQEDIEDFEARIEAEELQQATLQESIDRLRQVRMEAPGVEADLAAANAVIPHDPALPSALRQLQTAADEAGTVLNAVTTTRPTEIDDEEAVFAAFTITMQVDGSYFQIVDLLRRLEDPVITPRSFLWDAVNINVSEYPELSASLSGQLFTVAQFSELPQPEQPEEEAEGTVDPDADVDGSTDENVDDPVVDDGTEEE